MKIALCLIVKDEEKVLGRCLQSFKGLVDEIHIADTGSKDKTVLIAKQHKAKVKNYKEQWAVWSDKETIESVYDTKQEAKKHAKKRKVARAPLNYARARNFAQRDVNADVIFSVDADEYLHPRSRENFRALVEKYIAESPTVLIPIWSGYDKNDENPGNKHFLVRLFKKKYAWENRIHEIIAYEKRVVGDELILLHGKHTKTHTKEQMNLKHRTYIANLKYDIKEQPNNPRPRFYLGTIYFEIGRYLEAIDAFNAYLSIAVWQAERAQALLYLGRAYKALKDVGSAEFAFIRAAIADPSRVEPWTDLGDVVNGTSWKKACGYYEVATKYENKVPQSMLFLEPKAYTWLPWYRLSIGYDKLKDHHRGLQAAENALKYIPEDPDMNRNKRWHASQPTINPIMPEEISDKPVNIIIPSATPTFARKCIDSIMSAKTDVPYMITLIADGQEDFGEFPVCVEIKKGKQPFIFARNINQGITRSSDIVILNDDTEVSDYWLDDLQQVSYDGPLGITSPLVTDIGNINQNAVSKQEELWWKSEEDFLCFVCAYIPKEVIIQVGLLDEAFVWYGYEDNDYCYRARLNNFYLKVCHTSTIKHRRHSTFKETQAALVSQAADYFQRKWRNKHVTNLKPKSVLLKSSETSEQNMPKIDQAVKIETFDNQGTILYGKSCEIRHGTYIEVLGGTIEFEDDVVIGPQCVLQGNGGIFIGRGSVISAHCNIFSSRHPDTSTPFRKAALSKSRVVIGENVLLEQGVTVRPGVIIGDGCIVEPHSVVKEDMPDGVIISGNPAKVVRVRNVPIERQTGTIEQVKRSHLRRYELALKHINHGDVILDAGCGIGYGSQMMIDEKRCRVIGVDLSETAIARARKIKRENFLPVKEDLSNFKGGSYDLIVSFEAIEHIKEDLQLFSNLWAMLKPGGKFIYSTPSDMYPVAVNPYHFKHYSLEEFRALANSVASVESVQFFAQHEVEDTIEEFVESPSKKPDTYIAVATKTPVIQKKVLFTAGVENTDRPHRWDYVLDLFQKLSSTFESFGINCLTLCHPVLKNRSINTMVANEDILQNVMQYWQPDFVFIWNGNCDGDQKVIREALKVDAQIVYGELGWFPQKGHLHFDLEGVNAKISLTQIDLEPLTEEQREELDFFKAKFREGKPEPVEEHILIALQDEKDSNIVHSRFNSMSEFVSEALDHIRTYSKLPIKVRPHPHFKDVHLECRDEYDLDEAPLYESIMQAAEVHAINSTVLVEAALLDKKVLTYDRGLTYPHFPRKDLDKVYMSDAFKIEAILYHLVKRQLKWTDLMNPEIVRDYSVFEKIFLP